MPKAHKARQIVKVIILPAAVAGTAKVVDQFGMTNLSMVDKLMRWFITLPPDDQAMILGLYPAGPVLVAEAPVISFLKREYATTPRRS